jgi:hypothetical protein
LDGCGVEFTGKLFTLVFLKNKKLFSSIMKERENVVASGIVGCFAGAEHLTE